MDKIIVECPGCRAKLRFHSGTQRDRIECPRCGEQIDTESALRAAAAGTLAVPSQSSGDTAGVRPPSGNQAASRSRSRGSGGDRSGVDRPRVERPVSGGDLGSAMPDHEALAARNVRRLVIGLCIIVTVLAVGIPIALWAVFFREAGESEIAQVSPASEAGAPQQPAESEIPEGNRSPVPEEVAAIPADSARPQRAERPEPAARPAAGTTQEMPPAVAESRTPDEQTPMDRPKNAFGNFGNFGSSTPPARATPPMPDPSSQAPSEVDRDAGGGIGRVAYRWEPGTSHHYSFSAEIDDSETTHHISGHCVLNVRGNAGGVTEEEGSGTGFVVRSDGIIVTCAHVVEGATRVEVMIDGSPVPATVLASDPAHDLALLKTNSADLPVLALADSDEVESAQPVRAFGFPLSNTLGTELKTAFGEVSGMVPDDRRGMRIQISAPINPGNSGGPVLDQSGQVIGVASSKLAGSAVSSVGLAVPANDLRRFLEDNGIQPEVSRSQERLEGSELVRRFGPSVLLIRVRGQLSGSFTRIDFTSDFTDAPRPNARRNRPPVFQPMFPETKHASGSLEVNQFGDIARLDETEQLPYLLGPVPLLFLDPVDPAGSRTWTREKETSLRRTQRTESPGFRPRLPGVPRSPFGPRSRLPGFGRLPGFEEPEEQTVEEFPAVERSEYTLGKELGGRVAVSKTYEFRTTDDPDRPAMAARGNADLVFDTNSGLMISMKYEGSLTTNSEGQSVTIPVTMSWQLRDPEEVQAALAANRVQAEERRRRLEEEKNTPNPDLVRQLLGEVRDAAGDYRARQPLERLSHVAVVEDVRSEVLAVIRNHLQMSNQSVVAGAASALVHWASAEEAGDLVTLLELKHTLLVSQQKAALKRLGEFSRPETYESIVAGFGSIYLRNDTSAVCISIGPAIEPQILEWLPTSKDLFSRMQALEALQKGVGTEKSIPLLTEMATGEDTAVRSFAQRALDGVRARQ